MVLGPGELSHQFGQVTRENVFRYENRLLAVGMGHAADYEHGRPNRDPKQPSITRIYDLGSHGLGRAPRLLVDQFKEAGPFYRRFRQGGGQILTTPDRDPSERLTIGQVQPPHLEHPLPQDFCDSLWSVNKGEVEDAPLRGPTRSRQLGFDCDQSGQGLGHGLGRNQPAKALTRIDEALRAQDFERLADGHSTSIMLRAECCLTGQHMTRRVLARPNSMTEIIGDLVIANPFHLYYSGIISWQENLLPTGPI